VVVEERCTGRTDARVHAPEQIEAIGHAIASIERTAPDPQRAECESGPQAIQPAMRGQQERRGLNAGGRMATSEPVDPPDQLRLRLYVAGRSPNSLQALANIRVICRDYVHGRYSFEVVDALDEPLRALADGVLATPMLVRLSPEPICRILGDVSATQGVPKALGLEAEAL
jgi:circadian clock protein KaiB